MFFFGIAQVSQCTGPALIAQRTIALVPRVDEVRLVIFANVVDDATSDTLSLILRTDLSDADVGVITIVFP